MPKKLDLFEILNPNTPWIEIEESKENIEALLATQYLQRVFWIELDRKLEDFELFVYSRGYNFYEYLFISDSIIVDVDEWAYDDEKYSPVFIDVDWELHEDPPWVTIIREVHENEGRWKELPNGDVTGWWADALPNQDFKETLKWDILHVDKKFELFKLLKFGLEQQESELKEASEHFLACMARHPDTPPEVIQSLKKLNNRLIKKCLRKK